MMSNARLTVLFSTLAILSAGCMKAPVRKPVMELDCQQIPDISDDTPEFLQARRQVVEIVVARGGKYRWRSKSWLPDELQNALVEESATARITDIHLLASGEPSTLGNLMELGIIASAVCAGAKFERNGELHKINNSL